MKRFLRKLFKRKPKYEPAGIIHNGEWRFGDYYAQATPNGTHHVWHHNEYLGEHHGQRIEIHAIELPAPYPDHVYQAAHLALENGGTGYDILKTAWESATINTHDELDRLPNNSVVITGEPLNGKTITRVYEKTSDDLWHYGDLYESTKQIHLPATIIYWGE